MPKKEILSFLQVGQGGHRVAGGGCAGSQTPFFAELLNLVIEHDLFDCAQDSQPPLFEVQLI